MNKAQEAYIRANFGQKSVKELVEDTEATLADVKRFIKKLSSEVTPAVKAEPPKTFFHTADDRIVAMTSTQSAEDDRMNTKNVKKPIPKHVFVMDPNKPIR